MYYAHTHTHMQTHTTIVINGPCKGIRTMPVTFSKEFLLIAFVRFITRTKKDSKSQLASSLLGIALKKKEKKCNLDCKISHLFHHTAYCQII